MSTPMESILRSWAHSHEEDTNEVIVYRATDYAFPRSRGRRALSFRPDGTLKEVRYGSDDRQVTVTGHWRFTNDHDIELSLPGRDRRVIQIVSVSSDELVIRRSPEMRPRPADYNATRKENAHGVPRVPFSIDGEAGRPSQLVLLRDRTLHTVARVGEDGVAEQPVQIFTSRKQAEEFLHQGAEFGTNLSGEQARAATKLGLYLDLTVWEHIDFEGCGWEFDTNTDISDLTDFNRATACCGCFLWWGWRYLGTNASSFIVSIGWPAFGFRDGNGSTISWGLNGSAPSWSGYVRNLVDFGWNDRAISITLPGATYP